MENTQNDFNIPEKFSKPYDPVSTEKTIYQKWQDSGYFNPEKMIEDGHTDKDAKPFTIIMPPPNVTGVLHMGHAMMLTLEDMMIRYKRMQGYRTLWLPGTDHAAIATQSKVEKEISKKEGLSRHDLGRVEFLKRVNQFAQDSHDTIVSQIKVMGASCDWSREAFTLDDKRNHAVNTMFKKMYDDHLIYRGYRIVNWDPKGQTTIADDEIVYEERKAKLYTFKYSSDFPIAISTTRPETKVGDTAVAVHPDDTRYQQYIGQTYVVEDFCGVKLEIKIIADVGVEKDFGTGALGVTPAHSSIDWEMAQKNNVPVKQVINEYAKMTVGGENLLGKKVTEAREVVVAWLREQNLLTEEKEVNQNVPTAERTGGVIEPLPKLQWFIDVNKEFTLPYSKIDGIASGSTTTLKEIMKKSVENGQVNIIPEYFNKTYFNWIDNLRDWCISRQIWYGHRVPVWYKDEKIISIGEKTSEDLTQDEDTLDTWFSSGMWSFSTLGWPHSALATRDTPLNSEQLLNKNREFDLAIYHPTTVLETGYEIIFFWVARMIMMSGYALGEIPFETVYFHGTVRDGQGRKMSKSLGNGIDPLDIADKFGSDAARMALVVGTAPGTDSKISEDKIKGYKNFCNKIWNMTRFALQNTDEKLDKENLLEQITDTTDKKRIEDFHNFITEITRELDEYKFHIVTEKVYNYSWHTIADVIIEELKPRLQNKDDATNISAQATIYYLMTNTLKIIHPFAPFVTEEIWGLLDNKSLLMVTPWPNVR